MKLTCEPPRGVKNNLIQTFDNLNEERMDIAENKSNNLYKLTFAISLFHAAILERRKFGAIGWNIQYQFNNSDLETALNSLKNLIDQFNYIPWDALRYVIGQINYGGRITDEWDRRLLSSMLFRFCNELILKDNHLWTQDEVYYSP